MARPLLPPIGLRVVTATIDSARQEWAEGHRRFTRLAHEPGEGERLHRALELVVDGLRRRLGSTFTVEELAAVYVDAEAWIRSAFEEQLEPGWAARLTTVADAAFHLYSRSALDYAP